MKLSNRIKSFFKKSKKNKTLEKESLEQLKARYLLESKNIAASLKYDSLDVSSVRLFSLVKDFFSEFLEIHGSPTLEEIDRDFKYKHIDPASKERTRKLIKALIPVEFGKKNVTKKEIKTLLSDFEYVVQNS